MSKLKSKTEFVEAFLCGSSLRDGVKECYTGKCSECGFGHFWRKLRALLVGPDGNLLPAVDKVRLVVV